MNTAILNKRNIKEAHELANYYGECNFNCWGATLYALGKINVLEWIDGEDMLDFSENNTIIQIKIRLRLGDILALYDEDGLIHTAIYVGAGKWWHKLGGLESIYSTKEEVLKWYPEGTFYEIRRLKQNV